MGVKSNIFGSNRERSYYHKLLSRGSDEYKIYHNQPYAGVFKFREGVNKSETSHKAIILTHNQFQYLLKTSIDFVLCDANDKPLMCIEYDGLQEGFSVGKQYIATKTSEDKNRAWKIKLKLEVADTFDFLYIILASRHFEDVTQDAKISIADTIIGEWLAYQQLIEEANKSFSPQKVGLTHKQYEALDSTEREKQRVRWAKRWITPQRVITKLEQVSPLQQMLKHEFEGIGKIDIISIQCFVYYHDSHGVQPFSCGHPIYDDRSFGDALLYGEKCKIYHQGYEAEAEAWIPIFNLPNFWGFEIVLRDLVTLLTISHLKKIMKHRPTN